MSGFSVKLSDLITQFDGSSDFGEWIEKFEVVANLNNIKNLESVVPLFLAKDAFVVYRGLDDNVRKDYKATRKRLFQAFTMNPFQAFQAFRNRSLEPRESVDAFCGHLQRLAKIISSDDSDEFVKCAFVAGLPADAAEQLRGCCSLTTMSLPEVVEKARGLLSARGGLAQEFSLVASQRQNRGGGNSGHRSYGRRQVTCYKCGEIGHVIRECQKHEDESVKCYHCGKSGHISRACMNKQIHGYCCASGFSREFGGLPVVEVIVNGLKKRALVDTGCTKSVISAKCGVKCQIRKTQEKVVMMNGDETTCFQVALVSLVVASINLKVECLMADIVPGVDMLLGMDIIGRLGGLRIGSDGCVRFGDDNIACLFKRSECQNEPIVVSDKDFSAVFKDGKWEVEWNWLDGPPKLANQIPGYRVPGEVAVEFHKEVEEWIQNGWLVPYNEECSGVIPLMAVVQPNKSKVRPVLDYRELNQYVSSHSANSDVCGAKLRKWRQMGENLSIIDLKKAYLQLHVKQSLWKHQVVMYKNQRFCLTRLGFGLNVAPKIMTSVVNKVLSMNNIVREATDSYVDDIIVNNDLVTNEQVLSLLDKYGLKAKIPEALDGGRVLGLRVEKLDRRLWWTRDNKVDSPSLVMTRRQLFSWCGQLLGHFPVANWLRPACSYIKRVASSVKWDETVEEHVVKMVQDVQERLKSQDPVCGIWEVPLVDAGRIWCDASSIATGVCLEVGGIIVEDASWLRKLEDVAHINIAELEAVIKGLNLALEWKLKHIEVATDSASVHGWLRSMLEKDRPIRVCGLGKALVRRRLSLIEDVISEWKLDVSVVLVKSAQNKADTLTRVPQCWLAKNAQEIHHCSMAFNEDIKACHDAHHFGVDRTLFLVRQRHSGKSFSRNDVDKVVRSCVQCNSIDPMPVTWEHGKLSVKESWRRLACDVTHFRSKKYLTIIDCGPSRFAIWRELPNETEDVVVKNLLQIFLERGPPHEILLDNSATFRSGKLTQLCDAWGVAVRFRCAYRPEGNGIIERNHRTIKRMAARSGRDISQMVFWYNMSPRKGVREETIPHRVIFAYEWKLPDVVIRPETRGSPRFKVGQKVVVKPTDKRCTSTWTNGVVTEAGDSTSVEVNGLPRHVGDVRAIPEEVGLDNEDGVLLDDTDGVESTGDGRPHRERRLPRYLEDFVL